jgi:hypothetical protein
MSKIVTNLKFKSKRRETATALIYGDLLNKNRLTGCASTFNRKNKTVLGSSSTSGAAVRSERQVMDAGEEVLTLALLHARIYKKKKEFLINFLHSDSHD